MNWGIKIVIGMISAMSAIVFAGVYMVSHNTDTLEETDYYEKGLSYDVDYAKKENVNLMNEKPIVEISKGMLVIRFKTAVNKGMLTLRRPSDQSLDKQIPIVTSEYTYTLPLTTLKRGQWEMRLDWQNEGKSFLQEERIYISGKQ